MLYTIMKHIRNFFVVDLKEGTFKIENGSVSLESIKDNQYFLIEGSVFNDGVYQYPTDALVDEEFTGAIAYLAIPGEFIALVNEIKAYVENNARNGLQSESFGGYSYTKATGANGLQADWHDVFRQRLNAWRKI